MGREAICTYQLESQSSKSSGQAKVILESQALILRGHPPGTHKILRHTIPVDSMSRISVEDGRLHLQAGSSQLTLLLGPIQAQSWAKRLTAPPPTLAAKLGITAQTHILSIGECDAGELQAAIRQAATTDSRHPDLILATINTLPDLDYALDIYAHHPHHPPLWVIYPKGVQRSKKPTQQAGETAVREALRREGFIDTKVVSISPTLTALRFLKQSQ